LVNTILGNFLRLQNPGLVVNNVDHRVPITTWGDFALSSNARYENAQGVVRDTLWV
jgi:hypothetical protein